MKYMILGAKGTLGSELVQQLAKKPQDEGIAFSHSELAIEDFACLEQKILDEKPDVVINASAYNAVDRAEDEPHQAFLINSEAVLHLARLTQRLQIQLVHYSTDYVFDGEFKSAYVEESLTNPLSVYGKSKWLGEQAALLANPRSYVLRTAVVFGKNGHNFLTRFLENAKHQSQINMVTDLVGCPTPAESLAKTTFALFEKRAAHGLYHAVGEGSCHRFEFAEAIQKLWDLPVKLCATTMDTQKVLAKRPLSVVLKNAKLAALGIQMDSWQQGLQKILVKDN